MTDKFPLWIKDDNKYVRIPYERMETFSDGTRGWFWTVGILKNWENYQFYKAHQKYFIMLEIGGRPTRIVWTGGRPTLKQRMAKAWDTFKIMCDSRD